MEEYELNGYRFRMTCAGCPEQYDVFDEDYNQIAYIRLRWGYASCECPDVGGEEVYGEELDSSGWQGVFDSNEQREEFFEKCVDAIDEWRENNADDDDDW